MDADETSRIAEQALDLVEVSRQWRNLGHTPESVRKYRSCIKQLLKEAHHADYQEISAGRVVQHAEAYARRNGFDPRAMRHRWLSAFRAFVWGLQRLGISVGSTVLLKRDSGPPDPVIKEFLDYGRELGWAEHTQHLRGRYLGDLRSFLIKRRSPWPVPDLKDIDHFLEYTVRKWKWSRATVGGAASAIRAWMRFLLATKRIPNDLSSAIVGPRFIAYPTPPRALPWNIVRKLRRGIMANTPVGLRDAAQYTLLCAYGLGSAEILGLQLEDIDWDTGVLHIHRVKTGTAIELPLLPAAANAIAAYLRHGRPQTTSRCVFVSHQIPFGPLSHSVIGQRVRLWSSRIGMPIPISGTHVFRHSFATSLLENKTPLKVIGDILGHRRSETTGIYVRSALQKLRRLALPVPK
jgi:integrase/recombinase XerD